MSSSFILSEWPLGSSELRGRRQGWRSPGIRTRGVQPAPVDPVDAGRIQRVEILPAEGDARHVSARHREDGVDTAGLVADLDPEVGGDIEPARLVAAHPSRMAAVLRV